MAPVYKMDKWPSAERQQGKGNNNNNNNNSNNNNNNKKKLHDLNLL